MSIKTCQSALCVPHIAGAEKKGVSIGSMTHDSNARMRRLYTRDNCTDERPSQSRGIVDIQKKRTSESPRPLQVNGLHNLCMLDPGPPVRHITSAVALNNLLKNIKCNFVRAVSNAVYILFRNLNEWTVADQNTVTNHLPAISPKLFYQDRKCLWRAQQHTTCLRLIRVRGKQGSSPRAQRTYK